MNRIRALIVTFALFAIGFAALLDARGGRAQIAESPPQPNSRSVAVTVDDLPGAVPGADHAIGDLQELQRINRIIPEILSSRHVPAIGFVNEWKLQVQGQRDARAALLQSWLDAGLELGNHTYTHASFWTTPIGQYEDEVIRGEVVTQALMNAEGKKERYFRHPYLITGPTPEAKQAFEAFLKQRGYLVAPVTIDNDDYEFNDVLGAALRQKNQKLADRTKASYLDYTNTAFEYYEGVSRSLFHREIPQVLLIHDSELTAECLDRILTNLQHRGYRFISLDQALADPAYATPDRYIGPAGFSWLIRWKLAFGQKADWQDEPNPPEWVSRMSDDIRKANQKR